MRRGNRQKLISGDEWDWCHRWLRRAYRLTRKPGIGKYNKRNLARRRRREARRCANCSDGEEEPPLRLDPSADATRRACVSGARESDFGDAHRVRSFGEGGISDCGELATAHALNHGALHPIRDPQIEIWRW